LKRALAVEKNGVEIFSCPNKLFLYMPTKNTDYEGIVAKRKAVRLKNAPVETERGSLGRPYLRFYLRQLFNV
jgi:hypothetical protein